VRTDPRVAGTYIVRTWCGNTDKEVSVVVIVFEDQHGIHTFVYPICPNLTEQGFCRVEIQRGSTAPYCPFFRKIKLT